MGLFSEGWEEAYKRGATEERARILKQIREFRENLALHGYYAPSTGDRDRFAYNRVGELITQIEEGS